MYRVRMHSFREIIGLWDSAEDFAADVQVPGGTARQWRKRNFIPAERWRDVLAAARRRGLSEITEALLIELAHQRAVPTPASKDAA